MAVYVNKKQNEYGLLYRELSMYSLDDLSGISEVFDRWYGKNRAVKGVIDGRNHGEYMGFVDIFAYVIEKMNENSDRNTIDSKLIDTYGTGLHDFEMCIGHIPLSAPHGVSDVILALTSLPVIDGIYAVIKNKSMGRREFVNRMLLDGAFFTSGGIASILSRTIENVAYVYELQTALDNARYIDYVLDVIYSSEDSEDKKIKLIYDAKAI